MTPAFVEVEADRGRLAAFADVMRRTQPEWERSVDAMAAALALDPDLQRVLAVEGDAVIGAASVGRIWMLPPETPVAWCELGVLPEHRDRGVGTALLAWAGRAAAAIGRPQLQVPASEARPEGIAFLKRRGFVEHDRMTTLRLALRAVTRPEVAAPAGVRITTLADEPHRREEAYATAVEVFADLPDLDTPSAGTYDEWVLRDVDIPDGPLDGYLLAIADDTVVAYCRLVWQEGGTAVGHMMTGTCRAWRGRGVAAALKRAAIGWALDHGAAAMVTENDPSNAPMQAINRALGYAPGPAQVVLRGPAPV